MAKITITADPIFLGINSSVNVALVAVVTEDDGTPIPSEDVVWSTSRGTLADFPTSTTDVDGVATNNLSGVDLYSGEIAVNATALGTTESVTVRVYDTSKQPVFITNLSDDNVLSGNDVPSVQAMIFLPVSAAVGNVFRFYWGAESKQSIYTGNNFPWILDIATTFVPSTVLADGKYNVFYSQTDNANNISFSPPVQVTVYNGPFSQPVLLAPELPYNLYSTINLESALAGTTVRIPGNQSNITIGSTYTLYLQVNTRTGVFIKSEILKEGIVSDTGNIDNVIPFEVFEGLDNVTGRFHYSVTSPSENIAKLSFVKDAIIDTVPPGVII
ncbi:TPA: Ig-like domain-containing protein [Yersinia enterocolitica]